MTHPRNTRTQLKNQERENTTDGSTTTPDVGTIHHHNNDQGEEQGYLSSATAVPTIAEIISKELPNSNLSGEMLAVVNIICKVIQTQLDMHFNKFNNMSHAKDQQIVNLESKVAVLQDRVTKLEDCIDDVDQYERRDTDH